VRSVQACVGADFPGKSCRGQHLVDRIVGNWGRVLAVQAHPGLDGDGVAHGQYVRAVPVRDVLLLYGDRDAVVAGAQRSEVHAASRESSELAAAQAYPGRHAPHSSTTGPIGQQRYRQRRPLRASAARNRDRRRAPAGHVDDDVNVVGDDGRPLDSCSPASIAALTGARTIACQRIDYQDFARWFDKTYGGTTSKEDMIGRIAAFTVASTTLGGNLATLPASLPGLPSTGLGWLVSLYTLTTADPGTAHVPELGP
jgi:hypothetical protein